MAPKLWLPGAERYGTQTYFNPMVGPQGIRKVTWHSTEGNDIQGAVDAMRSKGGVYYHLLVDPKQRRILQFCAADRAARSLMNGGLFSGGCNMYGGINIQVSVVGFAAHGPVANLPRDIKDDILKWGRSWGVPDVMPHGNLGTHNRSIETWLTKSGHFSHIQAPGNDHVDPGFCSPEQLFGEREEMPEYAEFARGGFTLPAGRAVWLNWSKATESAKEIHEPKSASVKVPGVYEATVELNKAAGAVEVAFCEVADGQTSSSDAQTADEERVLVNNRGRVADGRHLRVKVRNRSDAPIRVNGAQMRLVWWKK